MLKLFACSARDGEVDYWEENIHTFFTSFDKDGTNLRIKQMLKINAMDSDLGFYKLDIKENPEFIRLGISDHTLFMVRCKQITLFFLIERAINPNAIRTLARRIDMLEVPRDRVFKNFDTLIAEDKLSKVQDQLGETREVLQKTIISVIDRGEKLSDMIAKTDDLKIRTGLFKTRAKKLNSCC
jgi:hypothetical protein